MKSIKERFTELINKMDYKSGLRLHLELALDRAKAEIHKLHGRDSIEIGPENSDCPCRDTELEIECASQGCGFCASSINHKTYQVLITGT